MNLKDFHMAAEPTSQFKLNLPRSVKESLEAEAEKNLRSINAEIIFRLRQSVGQSRVDESDRIKSIVDDALRQIRDALAEDTRGNKS